MKKILQKASHTLNTIVKGYNLATSTKKTEVTPFKGKHPVRQKIVTHDKTIKQVNHFHYLRCTISVSENDWEMNLMAYVKHKGEY